MSLKDRIAEDLKTAMKARDDVTKRTLRMVKSELGRKEADLGRELTDAEQLQVLTSAVKSRKDSIVEYEKAERAELADAEREEVAVIERYLPTQLSEDEARAAITAIVKELGLSQKKEMGQLMKAVMAKHRGEIDGKLASRLAGELLS